VQSLIKNLKWFAILASVVLLAIAGMTIFVPKYHTMCGLESRCRYLRAQVENKQRDIHTLRENEGRLLTDPEFVTRIAHQNHRVFPNELVFVFNDK